MGAEQRAFPSGGTGAGGSAGGSVGSGEGRRPAGGPRWTRRETEAETVDVGIRAAASVSSRTELVELCCPEALRGIQCGPPLSHYHVQG